MDKMYHHLSGQTYKFRPVFLQSAIRYSETPTLKYVCIFSFWSYSSVESDKTSMINRNVINLRKETAPDAFILLHGIKVSGIVLEINPHISCYSAVFIMRDVPMFYNFAD